MSVFIRLYLLYIFFLNQDSLRPEFWFEEKKLAEVMWRFFVFFLNVASWWRTSWKNYTDRPCWEACASLYHGELIEAHSETPRNITVVCYRGIWAGPSIGSPLPSLRLSRCKVWQLRFIEDQGHSSGCYGLLMALSYLDYSTLQIVTQKLSVCESIH